MPGFASLSYLVGRTRIDFTAANHPDSIASQVTCQVAHYSSTAIASGPFIIATAFIIVAVITFAVDHFDPAVAVVSYLFQRHSILE